MIQSYAKYYVNKVMKLKLHMYVLLALIPLDLFFVLDSGMVFSLIALYFVAQTILFGIFVKRLNIIKAKLTESNLSELNFKFFENLDGVEYECKEEFDYFDAVECEKIATGEINPQENADFNNTYKRQSWGVSKIVKKFFSLGVLYILLLSFVLSMKAIVLSQCIAIFILKYL